MVNKSNTLQWLSEVSAPDRAHSPAVGGGGGDSQQPPKEGRKRLSGDVWMALTCNCPTPFPHLNALLNHQWGCCYNPVVCLWCGDICVLGWRRRGKKREWWWLSWWNETALWESRQGYSSSNASVWASHPQKSRDSPGSKPPLSFYSDSPEPTSSL